MSLPEQRYPRGEKQLAFTQEVLARIGALPGVEAAGAIMALPLAKWPSDTLIRLPGRQGPADGAYPCDFDFASEGFFHAMGIPLVRGRLFDPRDGVSSSRVAIVNEAFVRAHFPGEDPLGRRFDEGGESREIVGVVGDVRMRGLAARLQPMMYRPLAAGRFSNRGVVVRTSLATPQALIEPIRRAIRAADPEQPVANARTLVEVVAASLAQRRLILRVLALFAGGAMVLAGIGLYGVVACTVSQRTHEIGIRMAVGASRSDVVGLFVGEGLRLTIAGLGLGLGLAGALALMRLLAGQLYGVEPTDPATLAAVAALLLLVSLGASWLPARRAARVDPMQALR
jgi:predicted permease